MGAGGALKRILGCLLPRRVIVAGRARPDRRIALTFDDGPHPDHTPRILDILAEHAAQATFFMQGAEAEKYPTLVRRLHAVGHEIGNHGYAHLDAKRVPLAKYLHDVDATHRLLEAIVGQSLPRLFRPPYGSLTPLALATLIARGYRIALWSADLNDSFIRTVPELVAHVRMLPLRPGEVLLLHEDYAHTVEALPEILGVLTARGHAFVALSGL